MACDNCKKLRKEIEMRKFIGLHWRYWMRGGVFRPLIINGSSGDSREYGRLKAMGFSGSEQLPGEK